MKTILNPLVSADVALFSIGEGVLQVLLVKRALEPQKGAWALPAAVLKPEIDRHLESTARRALRDKLGVEVPYLQQVRTFDGADRDPRGWSLSVLHYALLTRDLVHARPVSRVDNVRWADANDAGDLAFDHAEQLAVARSVLLDRVRDALPLHLMPQKFTLTQLQRVCELILTTNRRKPATLDKGAFRRRWARSPDLVAVPDEFETGVQRPAQLYRAAPGFRF